jgi:hypothetical protein
VPCDDDDDGYLINLFNEKSLWTEKYICRVDYKQRNMG